MTKWAKISPHNYHFVQLPKLVVPSTSNNNGNSNTTISDTEIYKNHFRLATLRHLERSVGVKDPIPKDERVALLHYHPAVRRYLFWPKNTPAHSKYAIPASLAASLTNHPMDVEEDRTRGIQLVHSNNHINAGGNHANDYCYAVPCYDFETSKREILEKETLFYDKVKDIKQRPTHFAREYHSLLEENEKLKLKIEELQQQQQQQQQPPQNQPTLLLPPQQQQPFIPQQHQMQQQSQTDNVHHPQYHHQQQHHQQQHQQQQQQQQQQLPPTKMGWNTHVVQSPQGQPTHSTFPSQQPPQPLLPPPPTTIATTAPPATTTTHPHHSHFNYNYHQPTPDPMTAAASTTTTTTTTATAAVARAASTNQEYPQLLQQQQPHQPLQHHTFPTNQPVPQYHHHQQQPQQQQQQQHLNHGNNHNNDN
jgi:hypothetical protein